MNAKKQRATLPAQDVSNAKVPTTPVSSTLTVVAYHKGEFFEPVTVRWYWRHGADGMVALRCCAWITDSGAHLSENGRWLSGVGKADGCGYHKPSAAMQAACVSAGIRFALPFDGRGDRAMEDAALAIARALGFRRCHVVTA